MKTLLVTSSVTFVPDNYDGFILPMAKNPHVEGLIVIDNRSWKILVQALVMLLSGAAPRLGMQLLKNYCCNSAERRKKAFAELGKNIWILRDINSEESFNLISNLAPDLILNARTRSFFKKRLLSLPKMGCINIHHGLLPDQRGLMCDFWAHLQDTAVGFSIHEMTSKLDDGALLKVAEIPADKTDYLSSLKMGSLLEAQAAEAVLAEIASKGTVQGEENIKTDTTVYRTNPRLRDFYRLRLKGVKI